MTTLIAALPIFTLLLLTLIGCSFGAGAHTCFFFAFSSTR